MTETDKTSPSAGASEAKPRMFEPLLHGSGRVFFADFSEYVCLSHDELLQLRKDLNDWYVGGFDENPLACGHIRHAEMAPFENAPPERAGQDNLGFWHACPDRRSG